MHPLERLLNLVILLLETPRFLTFEQIRERLPAYGQGDDESAKRMFERDKDVLRDLGVPVEVGSTDAWEVDQGYRIPKERYYLPDIEFTEEEIAALFVAAQTPGASEDDAGQAVRKLQSGVDPSVLARMSGGPVAAGTDTPPGRLRAVTEAIEERRALRFDYRAASGDIASRHVDPYSLVWRSGRWYVVGLDRDRGEVRSFRLSRFRSDPAHEGAASVPPEGFDGREHLRVGPWSPPEDSIEARIALSPDAAWWAVPSVTGAEVVETRGDGWVVVALPIERGGAFASWAMSFGPDAVVLSPPELRAEVVERLEAAAAGGVALMARPAKVSERLRRLLAVVPYVVQHPGVRVDELSRLFDVLEGELAADLDLLFMSGLPPYGPGDLIEVQVEDGRVWISMADFFARPLRLTRSEALALYLEGTALLGTPGLPEAAALQSALRKLEQALGPDALGGLAGRVEAAEPDTAPSGHLAVVREAAAEHRQVEIEYYAASTDETTVRRIDPEEVFSALGQWYVVAWDHRSGDERMFRLDRIRRAEPTGESFEPRGLAGAGRPLYTRSGEDIEVWLRLSPSARWVAEYYDTDQVAEHDDGSAEVTLPTKHLGWVARLALRLGDAVEVVGPDDLADEVRRVAAATLARYAEASP